MQAQAAISSFPGSSLNMRKLHVERQYHEETHLKFDVTYRMKDKLSITSFTLKNAIAPSLSPQATSTPFIVLVLLFRSSSPEFTCKSTLTYGWNLWTLSPSLGKGMS